MCVSWDMLWVRPLLDRGRGSGVVLLREVRHGPLPGRSGIALHGCLLDWNPSPAQKAWGGGAGAVKLHEAFLVGCGETVYLTHNINSASSAPETDASGDVGPALLPTPETRHQKRPSTGAKNRLS